MSDAVLDTGALIAFERNERRVVAIVARAVEHHDQLLVPAGVVAQALRDGARQARLDRLLGSPVCEVLPRDDRHARRATCGLADTADVIDASVAVVSRQREAGVLTSDPDDLRRVDRLLDLVAI